MNEVQGLTITPLSQALAEFPEEPRAGRNFQVWRLLIVLSALIFSFVTSPAQSAPEINLTPNHLLTLINQDRQEFGLLEFKENTQLARAAQAKAHDILAKNYFAHTSPAGTKPWDFLRQAGFEYSYAGENLALNYRSVYELQNDFLGSPSHRENLLSPLFTDIGIAVVQGEFRGKPAIITVQMFGTPKK